MTALVRSASLTHFAQVASACGLDGRALLAEVGLPARCLDEPDLKIPARAVAQLLELAAQRGQEPAFALRMVEQRRLSNLGPLGLLVRDEPTLRDALEALARHIHLHNEALTVRVEQDGQRVLIREDLAAEGATSTRQATELVIGVTFRVLGIFLGAGWQARRVCFEHRGPAVISVHRRLFGPTVEFGHDFNGIVCARSDLDVDNPNADPEIARLARRMLVSDVKDEPRTMSNQVHELILMQLGGGSCTIKGVARHLGIDPRTIQRHLGREGSSFSAILESVRRELAGRYLKERHRSIAEISSLLGFSATSGFSRWYRQQFRVTPSAGRGRA